jgi:hypothetical protein
MMQQPQLYQGRLGLGYDVVRGSRLLALRKRTTRPRKVRRVRIALR